MIQINPLLVPDDKERANLEDFLTESLREVSRGDAKYGRHPGPKRALGALRAEVTELQTEVEAENKIPGAMRREVIQVVAMGLKFLRDIC